MQIFSGPITGIIVGVLLILFRVKLAKYLEKSYKNIPQNTKVIEPYKIDYKIRPIFILILGIIIIMFSIIGLFVDKG